MSNSSKKLRTAFASEIARSEFKGRYVTPLDLAIARGEVRLVAEADRIIRGSGHQIRAWRVQVPRHPPSPRTYG